MKNLIETKLYETGQINEIWDSAVNDLREQAACDGFNYNGEPEMITACSDIEINEDYYEFEITIKRWDDELEITELNID